MQNSLGSRLLLIGKFLVNAIGILFLVIFFAYFGMWDMAEGLPVAGIVGLICYISFRKKFFNKLDAMVVAGIILYIIGLPIVVSQSLMESQRRGIFVVQALEKFHQEHGRYPKISDELVPTYILKWPLVKCWMPNMARGFNYTLRDGGAYYDLYGRCGYCKSSYDSENKKWFGGNDH